MAIERIHRPSERTPEEMARIREVRARFQRERPTLEELVASGECDPPVLQGAYRETRVLVHGLKATRERLGLGLPEVAERSGIDEALLRRLEAGELINPTVDTLWRFASALGQRLAWTVSAAEPAPAGPEPVATPPGSPRAEPRAAGGRKGRPGAGRPKKVEG